VSSTTSSGSPSPPNEIWTVRRILDWTTGHLKTHGSDSPRLDAEILLAHARQCRRIDLYTGFDSPLTDSEREKMRDLVRRRAKAEPVAHLVGYREFFSLRFRVTADVLVPRPDTETLLVELLNAIDQQPTPQVLEIGPGSGCVCIAAAVNAPTSQWTAIEISPPALAIARENAATHKVAERIEFLEGDLFAPLSAARQFDAIVSNPPYIGDEEMPGLDPDVRLHEPALALRGGKEGLDVIRRLITEAPAHLKPGGWLLLEIGESQGPAVSELVERSSQYSEHRLVRDLAGHDRVLRAKRA